MWRIYEWIVYFQGDEDPLRERLHLEFARFTQLYRMRGVTGPVAKRNRHLHLAGHALFLRDTEALDQATNYDLNRQRQRKLAELRTQVAALIMPELHQ